MFRDVCYMIIRRPDFAKCLFELQDILNVLSAWSSGAKNLLCNIASFCVAKIIRVRIACEIGDPVHAMASFQVEIYL